MITKRRIQNSRVPKELSKLPLKKVTPIAEAEIKAKFGKTNPQHILQILL